MKIHEPSEQPSTRWVTYVMYNSLDHQYALATNRIEELEHQLANAVDHARGVGDIASKIRKERDQLRQQLSECQTAQSDISQLCASYKQQLADVQGENERLLKVMAGCTEDASCMVMLSVLNQPTQDGR